MVAAGVLSALTRLAVGDALALLRARAWAAHRTADQLATEILRRTALTDLAGPLDSEELLSPSYTDLGTVSPEAPVNPDPLAHDRAPGPPGRLEDPVRAAESTWSPTFGGVSWSWLIAHLSPADRSELDAAQLRADRAADDQDRAIQRARAVRYRADTQEMAQLAIAELDHQRAQQRLAAIWERHMGRNH